METSKKLIENVSKMPAAAQQNPTTQANVAQAKGVVVADAQKRIDNISQMRPEARQHPKVQKDLAEAQKIVEAHGPKPENQAKPPLDAQATLAPAGPATSTHASGGSLPPGSSASTEGATPPEGHVTGTRTGEKGSTGTHTTNGVTPDSGGQPSSTGTVIPHATTSPQEIDLAQKITGNLDKVQAKRPLNPVEQQAYDRSRGILERAARDQPGSRNSGNPKDLVIAGDGPISQTHGAAAEVPPGAPGMNPRANQ